MATKRRILIVSLLIAPVCFASWLLLRPDPEPTYQGMPLSHWLDNYYYGNSTQALDETSEAVRQIGTNAIPTLLHMLRSKDSNLKLKLIRLSRKQDVIDLKWRTTDDRDNEASMAFKELGPLAKSAVPALIELYNENPSTSRNNYQRFTIVRIFGYIGPAAANAVPQVAQATTDNDWDVQSMAVWALGQIHANPNLSVPALTNSLRSMGGEVREWAAAGLGALGTDAKSAVPDLIQSLSDPSSNVVNEAAAALKKIDPEAAAKAGVK